MAKRNTRKTALAEPAETPEKIKNKNALPLKLKSSPPKKVVVKNSRPGQQTRPNRSKKADAPETKTGGVKPGLRSVYSNSRHTLLPLGFATDFKSGKPVVIFSDLATGQVHTAALSVWNRWKLKEVKKINTET